MKEILPSDYKGAIHDLDCLVIFTKKVCPFCKTMKKVMEKFAGQNDQFPLFDISSETDEGVALMKNLGVERVPTLLLYKKGEHVRQINGVVNVKELTRAWQEAVQ